MDTWILGRYTFDQDNNYITYTPFQEYLFIMLYLVGKKRLLIDFLEKGQG